MTEEIEIGILSRERIEAGITKAIFLQEQLTAQYRLDLDAAAIAEADFKNSFAAERLIARTDASFEGIKMTADLAEDVATTHTADKRLNMLLTAAKEAATRQALLSIRMRLDALRSLGANYRDMGV